MRSYLGDFTIGGRRLVCLVGIALVIGVMAALLAILLLDFIGFFTHLAYFGTTAHSLVAPDPRVRGVWAPAIPVIGGLIVGLIARYGSDKIRGHGIPEAIQNILERESRMDPKVALLKPLASAIAIGTGGPFGAEGPIIMTGGAWASLLAQFFRLSAFERRTLLVAGAAAGMSATFNAPISAVLLAVELLLFEWRPRSFIPVAAACLVAAAIRGALIGHGPVFAGSATTQAFSGGLLGASVLFGLVVGVCSALVTRLVYALEDGFHRLPIHWMWWPAIGGLAVGLGGCVDSRALGVGYDTLHGLVGGKLVGNGIVALLGAKTAAWSIALSSGTSGGVLAPLLMIGACLGSLASQVLPGSDPALWATVGMAAMLGGTIQAPFTATVFALETTWAWTDAPMVFTACMTAVAVTILAVRRSILTEKVARKGTHVAREYGVHPLEGIALTNAMVPRELVTALAQDEPFAELGARLASMPAPYRHFAYPVLDARGAVVGVVEHSEVVARAARGEATCLAEIMSPPLLVHGERRLSGAVERMATSGRRIAIVVGESGEWIGLLAQGDLFRAWSRVVHQERRRIRVRTLPEFWGRRFFQKTKPKVTL